MPNRLIHATSPYLLQHAHNPVDWYPWGEEALQKARQEQKPIFLSIGYAACHWCHVMAHESFEDEQTAALLNDWFVNIKVDREERPDLDSIYMNAVVAMTGQGGWPMSVFLTPEGKPFYGGTYFPPVPRYGMPAFRSLLADIHAVWHNEPARVLQAADQISDHLLQFNRLPVQAPAAPLALSSLTGAADRLLEQYDWQHGGWGAAPKFPQPMAIDFLLLQHQRGNQQALPAALHALDAMQRGGMHELVSGGFHRYSTDAQWLVPHFEKMLYDNAQLARTYLRAYRITANPAYRHTCEKTLAFMQREMLDPQGGFYSSLDADSEGGEGKYYLWTLDDIRALISDPFDFDLLRQAFDLRPQGNFEGSLILQRTASSAQLAETLHMTADEIETRLQRCLATLHQARTLRPRPATDDKVLVSWNALALCAFAEAARFLDNAAYLQTARSNAAFLLEAMHPADRLLRAWRQGKAQHNAFLEDYAALILALLALYQTDFDTRWYASAVQLAEAMLQNFGSQDGLLYDTRFDHPTPMLRPRSLQDNATPCGNALAALALLQLSAFGENPRWRTLAEEMLAAIQPQAERYPLAYAFWLQALDFALTPLRQTAVLYPPGDISHQPYLRTLVQTSAPHAVTAAAPYPPPPGAPPLLNDRSLLNNRLTVYVCENFSCNLPFNP